MQTTYLLLVNKPKLFMDFVVEPTVGPKIREKVKFLFYLKNSVYMYS